MLSTPLQREARIPFASGIIDRPRLLAKLRAVTEHKLTLICAPPGYGKTTLAAQFAHETAYPVAWHTVEERDRDVPNLFNQCLSALEYVAPGIQSLTPIPGDTPSELATLVTDYLRDNLPHDILFILDDVHHLTGSPAAEIWLRTLVERLPPTCHLILISRMLPDLPITEMIARREVLALGQEQLRFTTEEVYSLARAALKTTPSMADVQGLAQRLEGWPAGTVLALHPLPADLEQALLSNKNGQEAGPEALFNRLASTMLQAQPPGLRDFLLASSTLARLTPELCSAALGLPDSAYWLAEAQSRNMFLARTAGGLVYHKLFRNFLQEELREHNPGLFVHLHVRAARWFEEENRIEEAFDHYMIADLVERAATIAERVAQSYFSQGKVETLLNWRAQLRGDSVLAPRLSYTCARIHTDRYDYADAEADLAAAEKGFRRSKDRTGLSEVRIQRAMIDLQRGNYQRVARQATELAQLPPGPANLRGRALKILGVASLRLGELETALAQLQEALALHRADGDAYALANVLQDLGVTYSRLGRLDKASACLQEVVALRRSLGGAGALALALNNLGYYYHRGGNYTQAMDTFKEGLSVVGRMPNRRAEGYLLGSMGDLQRDRGAHDEALQLYNKALELIGNTEPALRSAILVSASTTRRYQGRLRDAIALAKEALALAEDHDIALESATAQAALWAARAQAGEAGQALEHLEAVAADLHRQGTQSELVWIYTLCAHAALLCADGRATDTYLKAALSLARQVGSTQPLVAEVLHTPRLEEHVTANLNKYDTLLRDLKRLREAQVKSPYIVQVSNRIRSDITYSLRVLTLGQEVIERDGQPISPSEWRSTAAMELFLYLLFMGPVSRESISLVFWPDSHPRRVRSNFHTTLYRARRALGENAITFKDGLYLINPELDVWCDAHQLETLTQQARLLPPRDARTEDLWRKAVDLYQGSFLPSFDMEWVIYRRESLQETFLEALIGLAECTHARSALREAIATFKRALDVDPYREDVHRAIMSCYAELGEKKQVLTHLRKLQELLREDLAIEPSAETMALAASLLN